jgi:hypothetical protein
MKYPKIIPAARSFLWISAFLVGLTFAYSTASGESLKATPDHFEFGTMAEGENAVVTTIIQNIGNAPVEITNVRTS